MALTADRNVKTRNPTEINKILAGAADTLYKGAILNIGTNGFLKVAADVAGEVPAGINVKQVIAAGANAEMVDVENGVFSLFKATQHKFTIHITDDTAAGNVKFDGKYFVIYSGSTGYYVWFDLAAGSVDPAPAGLTGVEIDITAINTDAEIAALIETALEALGGGGGAVFSVATVTHVCTVTVQNRGLTTAAGNGTSGLVVLVTNTVMSGAQQADVGTQFYAKADDGVIYASEKANLTAAVGTCVGTDGLHNLWIDTRMRAL